MSVSRYRLTPIGWIGAALFVLPTPIAAWEYYGAINGFANRGDYQRALEKIEGSIAVPEFSPMLFTALATASLVGMVMLLVGREIETIS
ncbi:hypothetical protein [Aquamicrobium defluvii]|uniref:Uncharacterized protein n=1 Tax=Aquamicrobium defluvii TaxID=69279 RepID=A0A011TAS1_9HYPH|nr:hypothetical protein [Aquamicrobium defluvii]EXL08734.1 hypothetical protein BG36_03480 [Aquamicrobium defluvii]EZQ14899.1 hypothetical protein CF98_14920 [Halopseudomonas bauzanensis]